MKRQQTSLMEELFGRDPRNRSHVLRAMDIIMRRSDGRYMTAATATDLRAARVPLPANFKICKTVSKDGILLGQFYLLESGPMFSDNIITKCADCGSALQIRPHAQAAAVRLCCFCTVDRLHKEDAEKALKKKRK